MTKSKEIGLKTKTINYTYIAYLPAAFFCIWQFFDHNGFTLGAMAGAAATVVAMHCRDDLDRRARSEAQKEVSTKTIG